MGICVSTNSTSIVGVEALAASTVPALTATAAAAERPDGAEIQVSPKMPQIHSRLSSNPPICQPSSSSSVMLELSQHIIDSGSKTLSGSQGWHETLTNLPHPPPSHAWYLSVILNVSPTPFHSPIPLSRFSFFYSLFPPPITLLSANFLHFSSLHSNSILWSLSFHPNLSKGLFTPFCLLTCPTSFLSNLFRQAGLAPALVRSILLFA